MTTTTLPTHPKHGGSELASDIRIRTRSRYARSVVRLGVGAIPAGTSARKVTGGPLVEGPWVYCYPLAVVIAKDPLPAETVIDAEPGDLFVIDRVTYRLVDNDPWGYPDLAPVG